MTSLVLMLIVGIYKKIKIFNKIVSLVILIVIAGINKIVIIIKMFNNNVRLNIMTKIKLLNNNHNK